MARLSKCVEWPNGGHTHIETTSDGLVQISDVMPDRTNVRTWDADSVRKLITSHTILIDMLDEALVELNA